MGGEVLGRESIAELVRQVPPLIGEFCSLDDQLQPKSNVWPDWRRNPASSSVADQVQTLWNSSALICLLAFVMLLCLEWFLRRKWGMV